MRYPAHRTAYLFFLLLGACDDGAAGRVDRGDTFDSGVSDASGNSGSTSEDHDAEAGRDAASTDAPDLWEGCPTAADYVGPDAGAESIVATETAVYCALFYETRTLKEELAMKAQMRIAPGKYPLNQKGAAAYSWPVCFRGVSAPHPILGAPAPLSHEGYTFEDTNYDSYAWNQPVMQGSERPELQVIFGASTRAKPPARTLMLDGRHPGTGDEPGFVAVLCRETDPCYPAQVFDSCTFEGASRHQHDVTFSGGNVSLFLNIGLSFSSTEPGAFVRASGRYRGKVFDQRSYWKLVYSPTHHHSARDFVVLFDEPIEGACGIEFAGLEPPPSAYQADEAFSVDCALNRLSTLTVSKHTHTRTE